MNLIKLEPCIFANLLLFSIVASNSIAHGYDFQEEVRDYLNGTLPIFDCILNYHKDSHIDYPILREELNLELFKDSFLSNFMIVSVSVLNRKHILLKKKEIETINGVIQETMDFLNGRSLTLKQFAILRQKLSLSAFLLERRATIMYALAKKMRKSDHYNSSQSVRHMPLSDITALIKAKYC